MRVLLKRPPHLMCQSDTWRRLQTCESVHDALKSFPCSARGRYTEVVGSDSITEPVAVIDQTLDDAQHVRIGSFAMK
ncbi:hypothetical protein CKO51_18790 [Rhodopirellula sp. SM50]|nr:hypothetical protein CKO51_18790 [Rhodopirellula sp. SM50]